MSASTLHDLIGVGFGPSNLALAIALQELSQNNGKPIDALFMDKQEHYRWHGDTLSSQSELQISFLKDLVSLRNPTSPTASSTTSSSRAAWSTSSTSAPFTRAGWSTTTIWLGRRAVRRAGTVWRRSVAHRARAR